MSYNVEHEVANLCQAIKRIGSQNDDGSVELTYGALFNDDDVQQTFESLFGTLKAARTRKKIAFKDKNVKITMTKDAADEVGGEGSDEEKS